MKTRSFPGLMIVVLLVLSQPDSWAAPQAAAASQTNLPDPGEILGRVIKRAQAVAQAGDEKHYVYDKRSVEEELADDGHAEKTTEKLYQVRLVGGMPFPRLVKIQGHELTATELAEVNKREEAFRKRVTGVDEEKKRERKESMLPEQSEMTNRFEFKVARREMIAGRPTLVITLNPRPSVTAPKTLQDKLFSGISGTIWVDEQEHEVAKMRVSMDKTISMGWFGMVGSLSTFQLTMERQRMPDGVWVNVNSIIAVHYRVLLSTHHYRMTEHSSGFSKE